MGGEGWLSEWWLALGAALLVTAALGFLLVRNLPQVGRVVLQVSLYGSLLLCAAALFWPAPFRSAARESVETTGLPAFLAEVDQRVDSIENLPGSVWQKLRSPFGSREDEAPAPTEADPGAPDASDETAPTRVPGPLESAIVPAVEDATAFGLRAVALAMGAFALLVSLSLRLAAAALARIGGLRRRVAELETRVERLAQERATPALPPPDPRQDA